jgi:hypothetical protein
MTNGPLIEFTVGNRQAGESIQLPAGGQSLEFHAKVWSTLPLTRAVIYNNGKVWKEVPLSADRRLADFREQAKVTESGWYSLSVEGERTAGSPDPSFPQAVGNPVRVYVGDGKIRSRESAEYFIRWIDKLRKMAEAQPGWRSQTEKDRVFAVMDEARKVYQQRASEAR